MLRLRPADAGTANNKLTRQRKMPNPAWTLSTLPDSFVTEVQARMDEHGGQTTSVRFGTLGTDIGA
ncbi:hypothetical protein AWB78_02415 [Caballeronia calidae]|uniref:Uncharacterized protein n=1 Tax=Caballeronia calidae TaxID=1777139 RepID=A0A158B8W7_9BURK|nr:hypothetical protein AWB78_02415 [Caballeronia calidae]